MESLMPLSRISCNLGSYRNVVSGENFVCPFFFLQLLRTRVRNENGVLRDLTLAGIKLVTCFSFGVRPFCKLPSTINPQRLARVDRYARNLHLRLVHGSKVGELERGVVVVISLVVALGTEVNIGKATEVGALFTNVHLNYLIET